MAQQHRRSSRDDVSVARASTRAREHLGSERGSNAVEFALVVPVLLLLVIGIMEFGHVLNAQLQVTAAARDAARVVSISAEPVTTMDQARTAAVNAAPTLSIDPAAVQITVDAAGTTSRPCPPGSTATVTIEYPVDLLTGMLGESMTVTGKGVMRCGV